MGFDFGRYYKLQVGKKGKKYVAFIKYGRVGTTVGDFKTYDYGSEKGAIQFFVEKFEEKTGNKWVDRDRFQKKPGKYFMVDMDDGWGEDDEEVKQTLKRQKLEKEGSQASDGSQTTTTTTTAQPERLPERVGDLMKYVLTLFCVVFLPIKRLLFDQDMMKKQLVELKVDIKKMPLGKISKKQILQGYAVQYAGGLLWMG